MWLHQGEIMGADRAFKQISICAAVLIIFCVICRLTVFNSYTVYVPLPWYMEEPLGDEDLSVEVEMPDVLGYGKPENRDGYVRIPIEPGHAGESFIIVHDAQGGNIGSRFLKVGPFGTVYDLSSGGFTGDRAVMIAVPVFWLLVSVIMLWHFFRAKGPAMYSYATIYYAGFSLFAFISGVVILNAAIRHIVNPREFSMYMTYGVIKSASSQFMFLTAPLIGAFALSLILCNIALLRHERPRIQNVFGILISVLLIVGEALGWLMFARNYSGSETMRRVLDTIQNTYATVFVYFECMLMGSVICGLRAARNKPVHDKDFIVILGCWFRKDGSLPPLLKGRVDKAIEFWKQQKEETGKEAILIPSGGQGRDETMPEAEAMQRYLLSQGFSQEMIRSEKASANTYQNMEFSGKIIRDINPDGKVVFATTNYHVFRSGVWANLAGLPAEGIGSRTKWWFWPNAFMRETIGLLQNRWKQEILFLVILVAFFGVLSMIL